MPKLSIITINLNNKSGFQKTMESVFAQTFTDYEYIVIDGGSTDGSKELIEHHGDKFAYWVSEKDEGIYQAMNKGIIKAKGKWLYFLNSEDVLIDKSVLQKIFALPIKKEAVLIYGKSLISPDNFITPNDFNFEKLIRYNICHQAIFYSKQIFKHYKYESKFGVLADWDLNLKIFANYESEKILPLDLVICNFFNTGISADWKNRKEYIKYFKNPIQLYFRYCNFLKASYFSLSYLLQARDFNKSRFLPFFSF